MPRSAKAVRAASPTPPTPEAPTPKPAATAAEPKHEANKPKPAAPRSAPALPANGLDLQRRLYDYDARLARQGVCKEGDLVKHIVQAGVRAGYEGDLASWSGPAIQLAVEETRAFESQARQRAAETKEVA
jgi:hypothetical protein